LVPDGLPRLDRRHEQANAKGAKLPIGELPIADLPIIESPILSGPHFSMSNVHQK
jgi:hypothetical protein